MTHPSNPDLRHLQAGESEAIAIATLVHADLILMDDLDGRSAARKMGLQVVGTLGVLDEAASRGLLELQPALERLLRTSFRVATDLLQQMRERDVLRQKQNDAPDGK